MINMNNTSQRTGVCKCLGPDYNQLVTIDNKNGADKKDSTDSNNGVDQSQSDTPPLYPQNKENQ